MSNQDNNYLQGLESEGEVPKYLKSAVVSEIDIIRDTMNFITHSVGHFMDVALMVVTESVPPDQKND